MKLKSKVALRFQSRNSARVEGASTHLDVPLPEARWLGAFYQPLFQRRLSPVLREIGVRGRAREKLELLISGRQDSARPSPRVVFGQHIPKR